MKKLLTFLSCLLVTFVGFAQQKTAKVTLNSGAVLTGVVVDINPTSHITLVIAGFETRVEMSDVASIEDIAVEGAASSSETVPASCQDYPSECIIEVGPYKLEMVLIKGAQFTMGFEGKGSRKMHSEPAHEVILSDFYINRFPLDGEVAAYLQSEDGGGKDKTGPFRAKNWEEANSIAEALKNKTGVPFGLITEAQWEYIALTEMRYLIREEKNESNYCYDWFGDYHSSGIPLIDPVGPPIGDSHVVRFWSKSGTELYIRRSWDNSSRFIRVTVPAAKMR